MRTRERQVTFGELNELAWFTIKKDGGVLDGKNLLKISPLRAVIQGDDRPIPFRKEDKVLIKVPIPQTTLAYIVDEARLSLDKALNKLNQAKLSFVTRMNDGYVTSCAAAIEYRSEDLIKAEVTYHWAKLEVAAIIGAATLQEMHNALVEQSKTRVYKIQEANFKYSGNPYALPNSIYQYEALKHYHGYGVDYDRFDVLIEEGLKDEQDPDTGAEARAINDRCWLQRVIDRLDFDDLQDFFEVAISERGSVELAAAVDASMPSMYRIGENKEDAAPCAGCPGQGSCCE
jgi:hypothetical protein